MEPLQVFNSWYSQVPPANFVESKVLENQDGCGVKGFNNRIVGGSRIARYFVSTTYDFIHYYEEYQRFNLRSNKVIMMIILVTGTNIHGCALCAKATGTFAGLLSSPFTRSLQ